MSGLIKTSDTVKLLEQWGLWSRSSGLRLGYVSPMLQIMRDHIEAKGGGESVFISDEMALEIDRLICLLASKEMLVARALWLHYVRGLKFIYLAEKLGRSRNLVANLHDQGVMWLDGHLTAQCEEDQQPAETA